jgi:hypothetical protein
MALLLVLGIIAFVLSTDFSRKVIPLESLPALALVGVSLVVLLQIGHLG